MKRTHNFSGFNDESLDPDFGSPSKRSPKAKRRPARQADDDGYFFATDDEFLEGDMGDIRPRAAKRRHFREQD